MNEKYTAQAASQEEAINKGLNALGITKDEAIITVEEEGKAGFFGFGQKDAVVVIEKKEKVDVIDEFLTNEFDLKNEKTEVNQSDSKDAQTEERKNKKEKERKKKERKEKEKRAKEKEKKKREKKAREKKEKKRKEKEKEKEKENKKSQINQKLSDDDAIKAVHKYLKEIILSMGISDVKVYTSRVKKQVKYDIKTGNAGLVIGRHGKVLNGLQTLTQNHMHQLAENKIFVRVDAEKYRERRRKTVENLAKRTADRAIKTKKSVKLDPMSAYERKQIHRYLNGNPKVDTHSEGREPKRYLVVKPTD